MGKNNLQIGTLKCYGGFRPDERNGLIVPITGGEELYFHRDFICNPIFFEKNRKQECLVIYRTEQVKYRVKLRAVQVRLMSELTIEELQELAGQYAENETVQQKLKKEFPYLFLEKNLENYFAYFSQKEVRELLKSRYESGYFEQSLAYVMGEWLYSREGEYFKTDRGAVFSIPSGSQNRLLVETFLAEIDWSREKAENLEMLLRAVKSRNFSTKGILSSSHFTNLKSEKIYSALSCMDWQKLDIPALFSKVDDLIFAMQYVKFDVRAVILDKLEKQLSADAEYLKALLEAVSDEVKIEILEKLPDEYQHTEAVQNELLRIFAQVSDSGKMRILQLLSDENLLQIENVQNYLASSRFSTLIKNIDWQDKRNVEKYRKLLSKTEASEGICPEILTGMQKSGCLFDLQWWEILTDSVKIRMIIYASNFPEEMDLWRKNLTAVNQLEMERENALLCAVLRFFVNIYPAKKEEKQRVFMKAHHYLMQYIAESFGKGTDVTPALSALCNHCQSPNLAGREQYFCDARVWKKHACIFCPEGFARPNAGRRSCSFMKYALTESYYQRTKQYQNQYLVDLLVNVGFEPDFAQIAELENPEIEGMPKLFERIYSKNAADYSYRISAFINMLIKMRRHMHCETCKKAMYPNFAFSKKINAKVPMTRFYCVEFEQEAGEAKKHDGGVYLNFCASCGKIIDSRECLQRERGDAGSYVCMRCGATAKTESSKGRKMCPRCLSSDVGGSASFVSCNSCGYRGIEFNSPFESPS